MSSTDLAQAVPYHNDRAAYGAISKCKVKSVCGVVHRPPMQASGRFYLV